MMNISYDLYLARVKFILERIRPLNILDETQEELGAGQVRASQVERGDPTLFLHFKNSDYARVFIQIAERYGIKHSYHAHKSRVAAPTLDTGAERTYSRDNLDTLFATLAIEIIHAAKERLEKKYPLFLTKLERIPLNLKDEINFSIHESNQLLLQTNDTATIVSLTDTIDHIYDAVISGDIGRITAALSPEMNEDEEENESPEACI